MLNQSPNSEKNFFSPDSKNKNIALSNGIQQFWNSRYNLVKDFEISSSNIDGTGIKFIVDENKQILVDKHHRIIPPTKEYITTLENLLNKDLGKLNEISLYQWIQENFMCWMNEKSEIKTDANNQIIFFVGKGTPPILETWKPCGLGEALRSSKNKITVYETTLAVWVDKDTDILLATTDKKNKPISANKDSLIHWLERRSLYRDNNYVLLGVDTNNEKASDLFLREIISIVNYKKNNDTVTQRKNHGLESLAFRELGTHCKQLLIDEKKIVPITLTNLPFKVLTDGKNIITDKDGRMLAPTEENKKVAKESGIREIETKVFNQWWKENLQCWIMIKKNKLEIFTDEECRIIFNYDERKPPLGQEWQLKPLSELWKKELVKKTKVWVHKDIALDLLWAKNKDLLNKFGKQKQAQDWHTSLRIYIDKNNVVFFGQIEETRRMNLQVKSINTVISDVRNKKTKIKKKNIENRNKRKDGNTKETNKKGNKKMRPDNKLECAIILSTLNNNAHQNDINLKTISNTQKNENRTTIENMDLEESDDSYERDRIKWESEQEALKEKCYELRALCYKWQKLPYVAPEKDVDSTYWGDILRFIFSRVQRGLNTNLSLRRNTFFNNTSSQLMNNKENLKSDPLLIVQFIKGNKLENDIFDKEANVLLRLEKEFVNPLPILIENWLKKNTCEELNGALENVKNSFSQFKNEDYRVKLQFLEMVYKYCAALGIENKLNTYISLFMMEEYEYLRLISEYANQESKELKEKLIVALAIFRQDLNYKNLIDSAEQVLNKNKLKIEKEPFINSMEQFSFLIHKSQSYVIMYPEQLKNRPSAEYQSPTGIWSNDNNSVMFTCKENSQEINNTVNQLSIPTNTKN